MTTHYEERMEADLAEIRRKLAKVSQLVENQVRDVSTALLEEDRDLASKVILGDKQVNRRIQDIDHLVHAFIIRHAPSARHLRFASAVLRLDVALERIGDYASTIGREVAQLESPLPDTVLRDMDMIAQQARTALNRAIQAFQEEDEEAAIRTYGLVGQMDHALRTVIAELLATGEKRERPLHDVFALLRIATIIKRVAEQAANICEQTTFYLSGELRDSKLFRILFVGDRNDRSSQIAEAYARKAFPESGEYSSAGVSPADELSSELVTFMDAKGMDVRTARPSPLSAINDEARHYHVIVTMDPGVREQLPPVPFRTVVLDWAIDVPKGMDSETLDAVYKTVVARVQDLMTTLAGPEAR